MARSAKGGTGLAAIGLALWVGLAAGPAAWAQTTPTDAQKAQWAAEGEARLHTDWAYLSRYRDANASLAAPAAGEGRVVFMGDSITQGWIDSRPGFFAGKPFLDRGISGQTTPQMLVRFRQDVIALKPAVVHILGGVNDLAGNTGPETLSDIEGNIRSMVEIAQANGVTVILASVLPADHMPWRPGLKPGPDIVALNSWMRAYAAEHGCVYLDYWSAMNNGALGMKPELTYDGVHATGAGYDAMGALALKAIDEALRRHARRH